MEVVLAKSMGFCFGVRRAVDTVYEQIRQAEHIYTYGAIVNNEEVVEDLRKKGVSVIEDQQALKKIPQKALTKTFYYPIVKSIAKAFGAKMTKEIFAKGVSKAIPVIGGVVSGGITLATLRPMGTRLANTLDSAHFDYTQEDFENDWQDIIEENKNFKEDDSVIDVDLVENQPTDNKSSLMDEIAKAKELLDSGIISEEEFAQIKSKVIAKL